MISLFSSMWGSSTIEEMPPQYQVYINSHGEVRSGFVSDLVNALNMNKINVVLDEDEGRDQKPRVLKEALQNNRKSIKDSKIALVIFSGTYTESRRVLKDLKLISECVEKGQLVAIPIFYKMDPSIVRELRGLFGAAFRVRFGYAFTGLGKNVPIKEKCRNALMLISKKNGIAVGKGRNEYKKVEKIVERVKTELEQIPPNKTIGIIKRLKESGEKLNLSRIRSQLELICLMLLLFCFQHIAYTKCGGACGGPTELPGDNMTQFLNSTLIDPPIVTPPMYCEVKPPQVQVFINFRGIDVRSGFIGYLVDALQRRSVNVFIDNLEERGEDLYTLFKRIEESGIAIVVFSSRYSQSKWCLNELVKINDQMHQGLLKVIPIFYKVTPTNVKKLKGEFGDHFRDKEHMFGYDSPLIKTWKDAIVSVTHKFALTFDENSRQLEIDFVETIVKEVLKKLQAYLDG